MTDCGALHMTEDGIRQNLKDHHRGNDEAIDDLRFGLDLTSVSTLLATNVLLKFEKLTLPSVLVWRSAFDRTCN